MSLGIVLPASEVTVEDLRAIMDAQCESDSPWRRAEELFRELIARGRCPGRAYDGLGISLMHQGRHDEALVAYRDGLCCEPFRQSLREGLILALDCHPDTTSEMAWEHRRAWWALFGKRRYDRRRPHTNDRAHDRPLRVGYVSGDLRHHSASMAMQPIICGHSPAIEAHCYSTTDRAMDDADTRLYQHATIFHHVFDLSDALLAEQIRADGIDILVDCSGFTAGHRLLTFCEKPAPIQLTGFGYVTGTGCDAMDGILLDATVAASTDILAERRLQLPSIIPYHAPLGIPPIGPIRTGPPVFGAFHRVTKLNAEVLTTWRAILDRVPDSRIVFKGEPYMQSGVQDWIRDTLEHRAEFRQPTEHPDHLDAYREIDLVLDPWPQTGGVTLCEALCMGVPSVTFCGQRIIQRTTASIMSALYAPEFITHSAIDYVRVASLFATRLLENIRAMRPFWRDRLMTSPISMGYGLALEDLYRSLWHEWVAQETTHVIAY